MIAGWISETVLPVSRGLTAKAGSTPIKKGANNPAAPMRAASPLVVPSCFRSDLARALQNPPECYGMAELHEQTETANLLTHWPGMMNAERTRSITGLLQSLL